MDGRGLHTRPFTPPITACINVYNDVKWLENCINSLRSKVKAVVVVDGAYEGFPHDKPYSTDGTIELAKARADIVVTKQTLWATEIIKRNHYIRYVPNGEWFLRIDADEELVGAFTEPLQGICYRVMLERTRERVEAKGKYYRETYPKVEGEFRNRFKL